MAPRGRWGRAVVLALLAVCLWAAEGAGTDEPAPSPTPSGTEIAPERLSEVVTTCRVDQGRDAQVVACDVDGLPPGQVVRLTVTTEPAGEPPRSTWNGAATAGPTGAVTVRAALPCPAVGTVPVRVAADAAGSYRHQQDVDLAGRCRPAWLPTVGELVRLVAVGLVLGTGIAVVRERRRERAAARQAARARGRGTGRRRRPVSAGPGRPGSPGGRRRRR